MQWAPLLRFSAFCCVCFHFIFYFRLLIGELNRKGEGVAKEVEFIFPYKMKIIIFFIWLYYIFFVINLVENNFFFSFFFQNESIAVRVIYSISLVLFVYVLILVTVRFLCTKAMDVHVIFFVLSRLCFYFIFCFV